MKITILLASAALSMMACKNHPEFDCKNYIQEQNVGFMLHGGIFDKYDNGRMFISIVHIVDPKNWDYNQYFTGTGFSSDPKDELKVLEKDSCYLKQDYFRYLNSKR